MIVCCGEALIDMLPIESQSGGPAFSPHAGGAVFNTAIALGRLGATAGFLSGISTDMFGKILVAALRASNVNSDLSIRSDRPTTLAFVELMKGKANYAFYDENTAGRMLSPTDLPTLPADVTTLFFGGISLMVEPCGATYEALLIREAETKVVMIDPNIRPGFIRDEARYRARLGRMIALSDIVKLSDEDLLWLEGPGDIATLARKVLAKGPQVLLITEGATGSHAFSKEHTVFAPARDVVVADTVGAGDTFNAGVMASLLKDGVLEKQSLSALSSDTLRRALDLGNAAAAITVSRHGANPPWAKEVY